MSGIRVVVFVLALVVATEVMEATWEVFAILVVLGSVSIRDVYGFAFVVAATILLVQAPNVSEPVAISAAVLAGVSVLQPSRWLRRGRR